MPRLTQIISRPRWRIQVPPPIDGRDARRNVMNKLASMLVWPLIAIVGAFAFAALALGRGESVNAVWLVTAALSVYFIAYRFYGRFIADRVLQLDDGRPTPAV